MKAPSFRDRRGSEAADVIADGKRDGKRNKVCFFRCIKKKRKNNPPVLLACLRLFFPSSHDHLVVVVGKAELGAKVLENLRLGSIRILVTIIIVIITISIERRGGRHEEPEFPASAVPDDATRRCLRFDR